MDAKLDSRQGQFPATFPDTFKDFFAMMSEDEDHIDLFSNLLEDKVIPHHNNATTPAAKFTQRRHGGSLRCTTNPHNANRDDASHSVGRSSSFRVHRPRNVYVGNGISGGARVSSKSSVSVGGSSTNLNNIGLGNVPHGGSTDLYCKHVKYCCLHQQQQQQLPLAQQQSPHKCSNSMQRMLPQQQQPQTHMATAMLPKEAAVPHYVPHPHHYPHQHQHQQQHLHQTTSYGSSVDYAPNEISGSVRLGPDGEDNNADGSKDRQKQLYASQHSHQQQHQQRVPTTQKRHSVILERAFDFDASCEESDTISTTSSTPTPLAEVPLPPSTVLKPILKKPSTATAAAPFQHQPHQQHQQHQQQLRQQHQQQHSKPIGKDIPHRTLPQPPKGRGMGAYHTKEAVLKRVQQQSGLLSTSRTNLASLSGMLGSAINLAGNISNTASLEIGGCTESLPGNEAHNEMRYSGSNYNFDATAATANATPTATTTPTAAPPQATCNNVDRSESVVGNPGGLYIDLHSPTAAANFVNAGSSAGGSSAAPLTTTNRSSIKRVQKSPMLARRRSSSIVTNLLASDMGYNRGEGTTLADITNLRAAHISSAGGSVTALSHSSTRDRISMAKSPVSGKSSSRLTSLKSMGADANNGSGGNNSGNSNSGSGGGGGGVLTFQQAMSGAVSPQYSATTPLLFGGGNSTTNLDMLGGSTTALASVLEDGAASVADILSGGSSLLAGDSPTSHHHYNSERAAFGNLDGCSELDATSGGGGSATGVHRTSSNILHSSSATIAQLQGSRQRQRMRTSSMPAESRKPRLVDTRRAAIHCADLDLEYYRLRSFSITSHGVCNLGDSLRSRRSRSINSVTSTGTSNSGKDRNNSNASHVSGDNIFESTDKPDTDKAAIPAYKIAMLGASGVGKTTLTYQFTTSDYICAYDLSLDDDYGQKTVSVLVDGIETDLEIIDHPACEMSTEAFCSTYNIDLFVVVYSVVDRNSFKAADKILQYLKEHEMLLTRGAILVGNKTDLERHREVNRQTGRKLAKEICCKFIETSSGLDHNVNELLVGIVAQAKLNPQRIRNLSERDRQRLSLQSAIQKHRHMHMPPRRMVRQVSICHADEDDHNPQHNDNDGDDDDNEDEDGGGDVGDDTEINNENRPHNALFGYNGNTDEGIGTGSEQTVSTSLSSAGSKPSSAKAQVQRSNKRTLNLESILKMGESELEDEEETQRQSRHHYKQQQTRPLSKFDLLMSGGKSSLNASPKSRRYYSAGTSGIVTLSGRSGGGGGGSARVGQRSASDGASNDGYHEAHGEAEPFDESSRKTVAKLTNRTKVFLSSVLKFKKAVHMRRRNSSSCSDLFVI